MIGLILVFAIPCGLAIAAMVRAERADGARWLALAMLAPAVALGGAYLDAWLHDRGSKVTMEVTALRIGADRLAAVPPGAAETLLVVGDRPDSADLVVPTSPDPRRALAERSIAPREPLAVVARRSGDGMLTVEMALRRFAPDRANGVAGMQARALSGPAQSGDVRLEPGVLHDIAIERVDPDGSVHLRRRLTVGLSEEERDGRALPMVRIALDSPLRTSAGSCDAGGRLDLRLQPSGEAPGGEAYDPPDRLSFDGLGRGGDHPLLSASVIGPVASAAEACASPSRRFVWPDGTGDIAPRLEMASRVAALPALLPLFVLALCGGLAWIAAPGASRAARLALPLVVLLTGYRLLFAVAGPWYDGALAHEATLADAGLALAGVPVLFAALLRPPDAPNADWANMALLLAGGTAGMLIMLGAMPELRAGWPVLAAAGALLWRARGSPLPGTFEVRLSRPVAALANRPFALPAAILFGSGLLRILLAGPPLQARERLLGFPLSVLTVAALLAGCGLFLARLDREDAPHRGRAIAALIALAAFGTVFMPWWVRDAGFAFVAAPPVFAAIGFAAMDSSRSRGETLARRVPLFAFAAAVAGLALVLAARIPADPAMPSLAEARHALAYGGNALRLVQWINPGLLAQMPTLAAHAAVEQQQLLAELTGGLLGRGWLAPADLHSLRSVQLSDNLPAVHVMWPFGRLAALALLAPFVVFAMRTMRAVPAEIGAGAAAYAGWLAAALLAWTAIYMVLANLLLVPFIGRNVYFLAPTSSGDLLEGCLLVLVAAWPLARRGMA